MNKYLFIFPLVLFLLSIFIAPVSAAALNISINEVGKIISFYDEYYIYQINGTLTITNPSNYSLYNIEVPLYLSTLDIRTNYSKEGNYLSPNELFIYSLGARSTETFNYRLVGITTEDLSTDGEAVLANAIEHLQPKIYSNLFGSLLKGPMEDPAFTGRDARLITVELRNPTDFQYTIAKIEVIKTAQMDPNLALERWDFSERKEFLDSFENYAYDFIDENATEGEIYWLTTDIYIDTIAIFENSNISRFDQDDLFEILSNVTINETINDSLAFLANRIYLRKLVTSTLVVPGDIVNITVFVNNLEPQDVSLVVYDIFPEGFELISVAGGTAEERNVTWNVSISSGSAKRLRYSLRYTDEDSLGLDYFRPAYLIYDGETFYSQTLPFIRKYIPQRRLFVQKNIKFLSDEEVQVSLSLQNLGESPLENIMVKEYLLSAAEFREISKQPLERGLWKIETINQSGMWEVSYVTDKMNLLNTLPEIYGLPPSSILQTLILSNVITAHFSLLSTNFAEILGVSVLAVLLFLYFVPTNFFSRTKRRQARDLALMKQEISSLHKKTDPEGYVPAHHVSAHAPLSSTSQYSEQTPLHQHSTLQDPQRVARHQMLDKTAEELKHVKEKSGALEEKK
jgi:hypothetical protein